MTTPTLRISGRSVIRAVVIVGAFLVVWTVVTRATTTLAWFVQAAVFAALAWPAVQRLGRHMPRFVAVLLLTGAVALAAAGLAALGLSELQAESVRFERAVPRAVHEIEGSAGIGTVVEDLHLGDDVRHFAQDVADRLRFRNADLPGLATTIGGSASAVFVVWVLTVMLIFTGPSLVTGAVGLVRESAQEQVTWVLQAAYGRSVRYLGWMAVRSLAVLLIAFGVATALDLDMPGLVAAVAALFAFVPYVGILGGSLPLALVAALNGPGLSLAVLGGAIALQSLDALVVQRRIDDATVELGIFPTLVAAMIGFSVRGPGGLLVGVAVATLVISVLNDTAAMQSLREAARGGPEASPAVPSAGT